MQDLLIASRPSDRPLWFAVDTECSPERGDSHHLSRRSNGQPIAAGWNESDIAQLTAEPTSWAWPLDVRRIPPRTHTGATTARQVQALAHRLGTTDAVPRFTFDAGYDPIGPTVDLAAL